MQGYLSISDFAKLCNVNPKSLRYYERIGALIPTYTGPETGYRYYALEQLVEMDMILMCLELNIPLRDAEQYRQPDQALDIRHLLQDGQQKALRKLVHLRNTMQQMEEALRENQHYQQQEGVYRRHLRQRLILREPFTPSGGELEFKQSSTKIFLHGQSLGLLPAFTFPIALRLGGCDYEAGGSTVEDCVEACGLLEHSGVDLLHLTGGMNGFVRPGHREPGYFRDLSVPVKQTVHLPVLLAGGVTPRPRLRPFWRRAVLTLSAWAGPSSKMPTGRTEFPVSYSSPLVRTTQSTPALPSMIEGGFAAGAA